MLEPDRATGGPRLLTVQKAILGKNDQLAAQLRRGFRERGLTVLNMLSSPGSGKTTLLQAALPKLAPVIRAGVIVGDLATENDAERLRTTGVPVVQINTGTTCHLDAQMIMRACESLGLDDLNLLVIENVGNLVCPAGYDLGESLRVVLLSVTEGEDKPLKYPTAFRSSDVVVISKTDLVEAAGFDRPAALANIRRVVPDARVFELSARNGAGLVDWCSFLSERCQLRTNKI